MLINKNQQANYKECCLNLNYTPQHKIGREEEYFFLSEIVWTDIFSALCYTGTINKFPAK